MLAPPEPPEDLFYTSLMKNGRVVQLTALYVEVPGYHVGDLAEDFAKALHPRAMMH